MIPLTLQEVFKILTGNCQVTVPGILVLILSLVQVSPIKINPWSAIFSWIGSKLNKSMIERLDKLEDKLDEHVIESVNEKIDNVRYEIISSASRLHRDEELTSENINRLMSKCDWYEKYCDENKIPNGVAVESIETIRSEYRRMR